MTYFWIIGGGLLQVPLIEEVQKLGYETLVTDGNPNCICSTLATTFYALDIFDIPAHITLADTLIQQGHNIHAVLAAGIDAPETMARLTDHLKLPGVSTEIAHLVNNKDLFRQKMQSLDLPKPKFKSIGQEDLPNLQVISQEIGYPLIIKNTSSSGSRGSKLFESENLEDMREITQQAIAVSRSKKALIESAWQGSEHTVETLFDCNGNFHRAFITDRLFDKSNGFPLETGLIHPSQLPENVQNNMCAIAEDVARKIGITIGAAKYDMINTPEGPRIIEMTVRLSGGFDCQYLVPAATGKNILKAAALTALGKLFDPQLLQPSKNRVGLSESLWPKPGIFKELQGIETAKKLPGFEHLFLRYAPGDTIEPYIDCTKRFCFIIASGTTLEEATQNMNRIKNTLKVITE